MTNAIFLTSSAVKPVRLLPLDRLEARPSGGYDFAGTLS